MSTEAIITSTIAILGLFGTLLGFVIKLSVNFGRMQEKLNMNEEADREEREKAGEKFAEIFSRLNNEEGVSAALLAKFDAQTQNITRIESKIDRLENMLIDIMGDRQK